MMDLKIICVSLLLILLNVSTTKAAKILCVFSVPSYSHQVVFQPIWLELVEMGHEMTVITPNILENNTYKNLRQVNFNHLYKFVRNQLDFSSIKPRPWRQQYIEQQEALINADEQQLSSPEVQDIMKSEEKFDLVIVQWMSPTMLSFGAKFKCPIIAISSLNAYNFMHDQFGNPNHPAINPEYITSFTEHITLWERVQSITFALWQKYYYSYHVIPKADKVIRKHMGRNMPSLHEIQKNISMMFLNVNPLITSSRPNVPTIVEFTGMHIRPHKPLPADLQEYLDKSPQGVIYMSLGTNVRSNELPLALREKITQALSELPYNILWKFEDEILKNKPKNIMIRKWVPQQDVLGHKNVKLFITQGGAQSLEEAIHNQVPLVGIPFFSDQPKNIRQVKRLGIGDGVDPQTLTKEKLKSTIMGIISNKRYKETITTLSHRLKDQPMTSLNKIIWWIEYVIRHKGAYHLRSPYADIPLWKYFCLDIALFMIFGALVAYYLLSNSLKYVWKLYKNNVKIKMKNQ